jgi:hypothetical protein
MISDPVPESRGAVEKISDGVPELEFEPLRSEVTLYGE